MRLRTLIRPEAEEEMASAFDWYEKRKPGLGDEFINAVVDAINSAAEAPTRYAIIHRNVRRILCRRFPYKILFLARQTAIEVIGVIHVKREPAFWQKRL